MKNCPDCNVKPGEIHLDWCDVERCPRCGGQFISCDCSQEEADEFPRLPWTGEWPGIAACVEFGWYAKLTKHGLVPCSEDDEGAHPDLNRLSKEAEWDSEKGRWVI